MRISMTWLAPGLLALAGCGAPSEPPPIESLPESVTAPATAPAATAPVVAAEAEAAAAAAAADDADVTRALSATERALAQLTAAYDDLAERFGDEPGRAVEWAEADFENLGDWEYRVVVLPDAMPEALEQALNALGQERWEAYWIAPSGNSLRIFLKRPAISYLSRVPLTTLLRMLAGGVQ